MAAAIWAEERIIGTWSVVTVPPRRSASMRQMSGESVIGLLGERAPTICATLDFGQSWMATSRTVAATARPLETVMSESGDDFSVSRAAAYRGDDGAGILPGIDLRHSCAFQPVPSYQRVLQLHQTFEWMPDLDAYHAPVARFAEQPRDGGAGVSNLRGNLRLRQIVRVIHASDFQHELDVVSRLSCRHCQLVCNHGIILFHPVWPVNIC